MLRLIWLESAVESLEDITGYIAERDEAAARRLQAVAEDCAERLPQLPYMYRAGRVPGTREAVIHPNYLLIYRVTSEAIEVISVMHARREYP